MDSGSPKTRTVWRGIALLFASGVLIVRLGVAGCSPAFFGSTKAGGGFKTQQAQAQAPAPAPASADAGPAAKPPAAPSDDPPLAEPAYYPPTKAGGGFYSRRRPAPPPAQQAGNSQ